MNHIYSIRISIFQPEFIISILHSYVGDCLDESIVEKAIADGLASSIFRSLICWLSHELCVLLNLDDEANATSNPNEFALELSSFLKELSCPYASMTSGPMAERFANVNQRYLLINYLATELMAAKMVRQMNPIAKNVIDAIESPMSVALRKICKSLDIPLPTPDQSAKQMFTQIYDKLNEIRTRIDFGKPLFAPNKSLTADDWNKLEQFAEELDDEYDLRREMLITRLDVTVQSFQWSDATKNTEDAIMQRYIAKRKELNALKHGGDSTSISELLAARDDLLFVEKTSSGTVRQNTKCDIQKHIIGAVPDRGGRTREMAPPAPEMPAWQKNRATGPSGGHRVSRLSMASPCQID